MARLEIAFAFDAGDVDRQELDELAQAAAEHATRLLLMAGSGQAHIRSLRLERAAVVEPDAGADVDEAPLRGVRADLLPPADVVEQ